MSLCINTSVAAFCLSCRFVAILCIYAQVKFISSVVSFILLDIVTCSSMYIYNVYILYICNVSCLYHCVLSDLLQQSNAPILGLNEVFLNWTEYESEAWLFFCQYIGLEFLSLTDTFRFLLLSQVHMPNSSSVPWKVQDGTYHFKLKNTSDLPLNIHTQATLNY